MPRYAVFSCLGLGDGLIALVLSNNLQLNGGQVTTFHPFLDSLQGWFPNLEMRRFPLLEELDSVLGSFDRFFIIYEKTPWMQAVLGYCLQKFPEQTKVLNPIATPKKDYPYWEHGRFDGNRTFVENLYTFCQSLLGLTVVTKSNGIVIPSNVQPKKFPKRVILHPMSSRPGKNWPFEKFLELADNLSQQGFTSSIILTEEEKKSLNFTGLQAPHFTNLAELTTYVAESAYMIGNDSGIGHLASCLGLPTLTICRSNQAAQFWRPSWSRGEVITPSPWIPNVKGFRLRDQHWKKWISTRRVLQTFQKI